MTLSQTVAGLNREQFVQFVRTIYNAGAASVLDDTEANDYELLLLSAEAANYDIFGDDS